MTHQENEDRPEPPIQTQSLLDTLTEELKECKDKYLRLLADTENTRKRMQKEKQDSIRFAVESALTDLLTPLDNFENALHATEKMSEDVKQWAAGFHMILSQFKELLEQNKIVMFTSQGELFNPHLHEAVETEETDAFPEGTILREFVRGYKSGDHVLRPARVKVAKTPTNIKQ